LEKFVIFGDFLELCNLYPSSSVVRLIKSRRAQWAGQVAYIGELRNACKILVLEPEGRRPLKDTQGHMGNNIKIYLKEVGCSDGGWIHLY
jgi:hypothetical protein